MADFLQDVLGGGDIPKPSTVSLSPETKELIGQSYSRAQATPDQIAAESFDPSKAAAKQAYGTDADAIQSEKQLGGLMNPNMVSAIRSKQGALLGQNLSGMSAQSHYNAIQEKADRLRFAHQALMANQKVESANYQRLIDAVNNENEIRAGVLKGWMSLAGTAVGSYLGGPAGGAAGSQLGSGVGGTLTGRSGQTKQIGGNDSDVTMPSGGRMYSGPTTQNGFMNSSPTYSNGGR